MGTRVSKTARPRLHQLVIFDRRLFIEPGPRIVPGTKELLRYLRVKRGYRIKHGSILPYGSRLQECEYELEQFGIGQYFDESMYVDRSTKEDILARLALGTKPESLVLIDDQLAKGDGLYWAYLCGATSIWVKRNKAALPSSTWQPDHTVSCLKDIMDIL